MTGKLEIRHPDIFDVELPAFISEFTRHTDNFLDGPLTTCPPNSVELNQPTHTEWLTMLPEPPPPTPGLKTRTAESISKDPDSVEEWSKTGASKVAKESLQPIPSLYQVYSKEELSFPIGKPYPPSGFGHAIISDISIAECAHSPLWSAGGSCGGVPLLRITS